LHQKSGKLVRNNLKATRNDPAYVRPVAFAVGLSVLAMAFAVGPISGGHFNPAVTCGMVAARRFPMDRALPYIITQLIGGALASFVFYLVLKGAPADGKGNNFTAASNLYGGAGFSLGAVFLTEAVITALFLVVIVSVTTRNCPAGFAPIAIGLSLTLFHLIAIPISNASLNPARSTATALFGGSEALGSLWFLGSPRLWWRGRRHYRPLAPSRVARCHVRYWHLADIALCAANVCF
jgi:aquaporin Z